MSEHGRQSEPNASDEVAFHLEMQVQSLIDAGWTPESARAEAQRRFGNVTGIERALLRGDARRTRRERRVRWLRDLRRDVAYAVRGLRKRPMYSLVSMLTLALGVGATSAVFALVDGALLRPLPFPQDGALVYLRDGQNGEFGYPASLPEFDDWVEHADFVEAATALATNRYTWTGVGSPEMVLGGLLAGDPLGTFGLRPLIGRGFTPDEIATSARVVMLGEALWRERFGGRSDVLGTSLTLSDEAYTVVGVMPRAMSALRVNDAPSVWMPMFRSQWMNRGLHFLDVVARLRPGLTVPAAQSRATVVAATIAKGGETTHGIGVVSLREELSGDARGVLLILMGAVLVVLAIVCANVANLVLARSFERTREFGLRMALGAGASRLARQVVTESLVLGVAGGACGLFVALLAGRLVRTISAAASFLAPAPFDARMLAFTLAISLTAALLFGLWPAFRVARSDVAATLRSTGDARSLAGRGGLARRRWLTGAQLALCVVLLASAGLLVRSMANLLRQDTGFVAGPVLTAELFLPPARYDTLRRAQFTESLLRQMARVPGVASVAVANHLPLDAGDTNGGFEIVGREYPEGEGPNSKKRIVSADYFASLGIPVLAGRAFQGTDRKGAPEVVIISEAVARQWWPGEDPVGKRIRFNWMTDQEQEIVGVVGDVKHDGLDQPVVGSVFVSAAQFAEPGFALLIKATRDPLSLVPELRREVEALDPALAIRSIRPMAQIVTGSVAARRHTMTLFAGFALVALLLATVGVYAIAAQSVAQRRNEIGLRMAIGAERRDVLRLVLRSELPVILASATLGLLIAVAATRVLRASLFEVAPADPLTLGGATLLLVLVAFSATWLPARRAARLDPLRALRSD